MKEKGEVEVSGTVNTSNSKLSIIKDLGNFKGKIVETPEEAGMMGIKMAKESAKKLRLDLKI